METRIFWLTRLEAGRVRIRNFGTERESGIANTAWAERLDLRAEMEIKAGSM